MSDRELIGLMAAIVMSSDEENIDATDAVTEAIKILDNLDTRDYASIKRPREVPAP